MILILYPPSINVRCSYTNLKRSTSVKFPRFPSMNRYIYCFLLHTIVGMGSDSSIRNTCTTWLSGVEVPQGWGPCFYFCYILLYHDCETKEGYTLSSISEGRFWKE